MARRMRGKEILPDWGAGPLTVSRPALLSKGSDRKFRQMIHALVGYANCVLAARDGFATLLDISGVQYEILMVIYRLHGTAPCSVTEVAQQVRRTVAFMTIEVNKLVAKGLVEKQPDFQDRRRVLLQVTKRGVERLNEIAPVQRKINDALFHTISAADFRALYRLYEKLAPCGVHAVEVTSLIVNEFRVGRKGAALRGNRI